MLTITLVLRATIQLELKGAKAPFFIRENTIFIY
jgi:hypothetical protein